MFLHRVFSSIRLSKEPRVTETFTADFYRRVSARFNGSRIRGQRDVEEYLATHAFADAPMGVGGDVRDARQLEAERSILLWCTWYHRPELGDLFGENFCPHCIERRALATGGGRHEN